MNSVLLAPLPYSEADRLVMVWETNPKLQLGLDDLPVSAGAFVAWRDQSRSFEAISAISLTSLNLAGPDRDQSLAVARVSASFFDVIGIQPQIGRPISQLEDKPGANKVAVISRGLWQRMFGAKAEVIDKTVTLDGESYTIIGVMPAGFRLPTATDLSYVDILIPACLTAEQSGQRSDRNLSVIARLKTGVTIQQAQAEMAGVSNRLEQLYKQNEGYGARIVALHEQIVGNTRRVFIVLLSAVNFVLLIACANLANLTLARSMDRRKEIALRLVIGATRGRIVTQLLAESLALAVAGGAIGVLLSFFSIHLLTSFAPRNIARIGDVHIDSAVLGYNLAITLLTGLFCGLAPVLQIFDFNLVPAIKEGAAQVTARVSRNLARNSLMVAQVALSMILLTGAGLMINSFIRILKIDPGFRPEGVVTFGIPLAISSYPQSKQQAACFQKIIHRVETLPGVMAAGYVSHPPLAGGVYAGSFTVENLATPANEQAIADRRIVSENYFLAMGIPLLKGRRFTAEDNESAPGVIIVSESWSRRFMPNEDPIGRRVKLGGKDSGRPWLSIVGVAGDVRHTTLDAEAKPHLYVPYLQFPVSSMTLVVKTGVSRDSMIPGVSHEILAVDGGQLINPIRSLEDYLSDSTSKYRFGATLLSIFAVVALIITMTGIYGVISYFVSQRTREIGIRAMLGAQKYDILSLILRQGLILISIGVGIGMVGAYNLTRLTSFLLYGVTATDLLTFVIASVMLALASLLACYLPARRATRGEPTAALRHE